MVTTVIITILCCTIVFMGFLLWQKRSNQKTAQTTSNNTQPSKIRVNNQAPKFTKAQEDQLKKASFHLDVNSVFGSKLIEFLLKLNPTEEWLGKMRDATTHLASIDPESEHREEVLRTTLQIYPSNELKKFEEFIISIAETWTGSTDLVNAIQNIYPQLKTNQLEDNSEQEEKIKTHLRTRFSPVFQKLSHFEQKQRKCLAIMDQVKTIREKQIQNLVWTAGTTAVATVLTGGLALLFGGAAAARQLTNDPAEQIINEFNKELSSLDDLLKEIDALVLDVENGLTKDFAKKFGQALNLQKQIVMIVAHKGLDLNILLKELSSSEDMGREDLENLTLMFNTVISADANIPKDIKIRLEEICTGKKSNWLKRIA